MLQLANSAITVAIHFGFGRRNADIPPGNFPALLLALSFVGSFMIIGAAWSKTSFAISLLRISSSSSSAAYTSTASGQDLSSIQGKSHRWMRALIWFIIVSVNLVLGVSVLFTWIRCWPLQKMWISALEGTCWNRWITLHYNMFTAGTTLKPKPSIDVKQNSEEPKH